MKEFRSIGRVLRVVSGSVGADGQFAIAWRNGADSRGVTSRRGPVQRWLEAALPKGVEQYSQETGRAGRDGLPSECVLYFGGADYYGWRQLMERTLDG